MKRSTKIILAVLAAGAVIETVMIVLMFKYMIFAS